MSKLIEQTEHFTIKFGGSNEIDSDAMAQILSNLSKIIKVTATEIEPNAYCKLNFKQSRQGSIEVDFATVVSTAQTIFTLVAPVVGTAWLATQTFDKILDIKTKLKDKKWRVEKDDKKEMVVKTEDGEQILINKEKSRADLYFKDAVFDNCVVNIFHNATKDENRDFSIINKDKTEKKFTKEDVKIFKQISITKEDINNIISDRKDLEVELTIKKPDFLGTSKWEVILDKKIDIKIQDEDFNKKVKSGIIKISAGCKIRVKMSILTKMDEDLNVIEAEYIVNEVLGDIIEPVKHASLF
jgi:hypothetical protein